MNTSDGTGYHYYLFEFGNTGYVINWFKGNMGDDKGVLKHKDYSALIDSHERKGFSNARIIEKLGYKEKYTIETHKAEINPEQREAYLVPMHRNISIENDNILYYFFTYHKINNFEKLTRYHASRYVVFPSIFYESEGEFIAMELYLN